MSTLTCTRTTAPTCTNRTRMLFSILVYPTILSKTIWALPAPKAIDTLMPNLNRNRWRWLGDILSPICWIFIRHKPTYIFFVLINICI